jgi:S1-C subfamily serine protease
VPLARFVTVLTALTAASASATALESDPISAVCPVAYRLDQSPSSHGYRYVFFGNAFFINEQGYMLTAAHVVETFRNGGQPFILVNRLNSPPRLLPVTVVATDSVHDVAILRAAPNPFAAKYLVAFLPLAPDPATRGQQVVALSLHPPKLQNARTFEIPLEDRSIGEVLSYESTQLEKSAPATDVFLLSHPVTRGQSGSPVVALDSHAVLGLIEGRWLRASAVAPTTSAGQAVPVPGAAVPIIAAIQLLQQESVAWHSP